MAGAVYVVATMDTKGDELGLVRDRLRNASVAVRTVDVGTLDAPTMVPDVSREQVLSSLSPDEDRENGERDRGAAIARMANALRRFLIAECEAGRVSGVLGLGGSGGTSLITTAMRALPIGLPKLMVSTVASGNVGPYVDCSDILMMFSVVDIAGINAVSQAVLSNAAHAMAGMVQNQVPRIATKPTIGMTMFGVTTPCVNQVRVLLEKQGFDCLVFHATGSGGRAMELLVSSGLISGVLDITTTEVADEIAGGVFSCGPNRFEKMIEAKVPLVLSLGALDMVNFGSMETVPARYQNRLLHVHNAQVTLMRTNVEENLKIARFIAAKINRSTTPVKIIVPEAGVSSLDQPGQAFFDEESNKALIDELKKELHVDETRQMIHISKHINDPEFAEAIATHFLELWHRR